jgi:hypothetical protein
MKVENLERPFILLAIVIILYFLVFLNFSFSVIYFFLKNQGIYDRIFLSQDFFDKMAKFHH